MIGGTTLDPLRVLLRSAPASQFIGRELPALAPAATVDDGPVLLFDADGDGDNDLLVTKGGNTLPAGAPEYQPQLFLNDGHGGFRPAPADALPPLPINVGAVAAADFDHDGRLGLFIGGRVLPGQYPLPPQSALLANRGGKFEDVTDTLAPGLREVGMVTSALWSDVDGDGWPDLLLTLEWGNVKYFHNNQGKGFEDWTEKAGFAAAGTGWWTSLAAADFNGDGRPDYVVGNLGLNTQYHADPEHPALLFSGDFKGDGSAQLIEGYYEGDRLYPWRTRRDLGAAIPSILKRFPRNDFYARATLGEIFGEEKLAAAQRFAATELRSGVFLSQPDGTYRFEPLPRIAQIAPLQGMVAGDFDGDGHADIYAVQNSYAPDSRRRPLRRRAQPVAARRWPRPFHRGAAGRERSDRARRCQGARRARSRSGRLAGLLDHPQQQHDARVSQPRRCRPPLPARFVLQGPPGNPTAVGARVTRSSPTARRRRARSMPAPAITASPPRRASSAMQIPILCEKSAYGGHQDSAQYMMFHRKQTSSLLLFPRLEAGYTAKG